MNKNKKLISIFLSVLMLLSCLTAGLTALAAEANLAAENSASAKDAAEDEKNVAVDESVIDDALNQYVEASEKEDSMTASQKTNLNKMKDLISDFGSGIISKEQFERQYNSALNAVNKVVASVFSANTNTALGKFEMLVNDYAGKLSVAEPTEDDLKGYNDILSAYAALSQTDKDNIDIIIFDKMLHLIYDREKQVSIIENPDIASYNKQHTINAHNAAMNILGNPQLLVDAIDLNIKIADKKISIDDKITAFANASEKVQLYSSIYSSSYGSFYYTIISSYSGKSFTTLAIAIGKDIAKENPFTETSPESISKPNAKDYADGENDPEYIKAFEAYMNNKKEIAEYNCRKANHQSAAELQGMKKVADSVESYRQVVSFIEKSIAAKDAFDADTTKTSAAKEAIAEFDKMPQVYQAIILNNTSIKLRTIPTKSSSSWSTSSCSFKTFYTYCVDIGSYDTVTAFYAVLDSINAPYTNDDITKVKDAYVNIPETLKDMISENAKQKYNDILASIAPDAPSFVPADLSVYQKTTVTYPAKITKAQVEKAIPKINDLIFDKLGTTLGLPEGGLTELVKTGLYTNSTVAELCKLLFPLLYSLKDMDGFPSIAAGMVAIDPSKLSAKLTEEKFAGAVEKLAVSQAYGDVNTDDWGNYWNTLSFENGDMGFNDGDKEGFMDAVAALFRPISVINLLLSFENKVDTSRGTYTYGAYEHLVPIFEMLDLDGYLSSEEYRVNFNKIKDADSNMVMDARIRPILVPVLNLVDKFAENPLDTLVDVLPKLAYAVDSGLLNEQVGKIISMMAFGLGDSLKVDLTTEGLYTMIAPMLENLTVGEKAVSIKLNKDKFMTAFKDLSGCGTAVQKDSVARGTAYRMGIDSDKADTFVTLFRWLYGEITTDENMNSIKALIGVDDMSFIQKALINVALSAVQKMSADQALTAIVSLTVPFGGGENNDPTDPETTVPETTKPNEGEEITDNPSIPKTGSKITAVVFALAAVGGLGAVVITKKKQEDIE